MSTIHLVIARDGEYDEYCEWVMCAFTTQDKAQLYVDYLNQQRDLCNRLMQLLVELRKDWEDNHPYNCTALPTLAQGESYYNERTQYNIEFATNHGVADPHFIKRMSEEVSEYENMRFTECFTHEQVELKE